MNNKRHKKAGFTLVEMLIVIVIIGILAAALIPRLTSARGRANDVARKASLQQIATALISYQIDNGVFPPVAGGTSSAISGALTAGGMASIPKDPAGAVLGSGILATIPAGEFGYTPIKKNGQTSGGIVLMTTMETTNGANYVICGAGDEINGTSEFNTIQGKICNKVTLGASCLNSDINNCSAIAASGSLRYIYVY